MENYITEEELRKREEWERCAANAYELPDEFVLKLIKEIRYLRNKLKSGE